jgi:tRNA pseudouridine55 synthase
MKGFLNIDKAAGLTSHDVVARVRRLAGRGVKVGHAGTLDPAATGVLPLALGQATRLISYLADTRKGYHATVALGSATTTDDAEGEPLEQRPVPPLAAATLEAALAPLRGDILQVPPMYAALHHQGQRLYDLARKGQTVERPPRPVTIDRLDLLAYDLASQPPTLTLDVVCSKGTYIRALARDLGAALGCGAHLLALRRTFVGSFALDTAVTLDALQHSGEIRPHLLPPDHAIAHLPAVTLDTAQSDDIRHGRAIALPPEAAPTAPYARAHDTSGALLALLRHTDSGWHPDKVLA